MNLFKDIIHNGWLCRNTEERVAYVLKWTKLMTEHRYVMLLNSYRDYKYTQVPWYTRKYLTASSTVFWFLIFIVFVDFAFSMFSMQCWTCCLLSRISSLKYLSISYSSRGLDNHYMHWKGKSKMNCQENLDVWFATKLQKSILCAEYKEPVS